MDEPFDLAQLIDPIPLQGFFADYWEQKPLLLQRGAPDYFGRLLSIGDIESYLSRGDVRYPAVRLAKGGGFFPAEAYTHDFRYGDEVFRGVIDTERLFTEYSSGATVTLPALHRAIPALGRLCAQMEAQLDHSVHTNGYLTPANVPGFTPHYDTHEVFVLQISGTKHWWVYPPPVVHPHRSQTFPMQTYRTPESALMEFDLGPGDLLYLPRGYVHTTRTSQQYSAHVTIGITVYTWVELLDEVVRQKVNDPDFRAALPTGFAKEAKPSERLRQQFHTLVSQLGEFDLDEIWSRFTQRVQSARSRAPVDFIADAGLVEADSRLRVKPGRRWELSNQGGELVLIIEGRRIKLQTAVRSTLEAIGAADAFAVDSLPQAISVDARLALVRYLFGLGFLERL